MKKKIVNYVRKTEWNGGGGPLDRALRSAYDRYCNFRANLKNVDGPRSSRLYLKSRNIKRNLSGMRINFITIDQASVWASDWVRTFPRRYDLIVGVPRSGMLVASIIALKLGKGLTTPDLLKQGEYWHSSRAGSKMRLDEIKHVLVVDDSVDKGRAMAKSMAAIQSVASNFQVTTASLIVSHENKHKVDLYHQIVEPPRSFEWNILHRKIASRNQQQALAVDLDGVLCANPPQGADDDEEWYLQWMKTANPYLIPGFEIDAIITCRLEKYREITEQWLGKHDVQYKELIMWDVPDKNARQGKFARHKIDELVRIKPDMFWESNWSQSEKIWRDTRIPTLCIDEMRLLN